MLDLIGMLVSFVLTFLVLLYVFEDNALFRLAIYIFIGAAAGYAGAVAIKDVLLPRLFGLQYTQMLLVILWIVLLLMKISPKTARIGNPAAGLLVGVGAAIAIGGAIQGTLVPQVTSSGDIFSPRLMQTAGFGQTIGYFFQGLIVLVGTVSSLAYFHFGAKPAPNQIPTRHRIIEIISKVGEGFIAITFGVIFAGIYSAALTALIERLHFLIETITKLFGF
ncbi:MAG TPA: hypothetical protein VJ965_08100 [Anaerolineales bacterium]|nr:hypothetical protein [Anaerolineales bacterium]